MKLADLEGRDQKSPRDPFYVSFADLMMLLAVFFVMLIAMSKVETGLFEQVRAGITGTTKGTLVELAQDLSTMVKGKPGIPGVKVRMAEDGVRLDLDTAALFKTGEAILRENALTPLKPLFERVKKTSYTVEVEGHTDDAPLFKKVGGEIETNWTLSGRRASVVVWHLRNMGYRKSRLKIVGFADTRPMVSIKGKSGTALLRARAQNRRVSILVR